MLVLVRPCKAGALLERDNTRMSKGMREGAVFEQGNARMRKCMRGGGAVIEHWNSCLSTGMQGCGLGCGGTA